MKSISDTRRETPEPAKPDHTADLARMLSRMIVSARKHTSPESPHRALADVAWAMLHDKGLSGSITRTTDV